MTSPRFPNPPEAFSPSSKVSTGMEAEIPPRPDLESSPNLESQPATDAGRHKRPVGRLSTLLRQVLFGKAESSSSANHGANSPSGTTTSHSEVPSTRFSTTTSTFSPATSSGTAYSYPEKHGIDENFDGTAVDHQNLPIAVVQESPVYVEPQSDPSCPKTDGISSRRSSSTSMYLTRVQQLLHNINELPWIAERVTVDYVPGQSKHSRLPAPRTIHRHSSWYGITPASRNQMCINSTSGSNASQTLNASPALSAEDPSSMPFPMASTASIFPPPARRQEQVYPGGYIPSEELATIASSHPPRDFHNVNSVAGTSSVLSSDHAYR